MDGEIYLTLGNTCFVLARQLKDWSELVAGACFGGRVAFIHIDWSGIPQILFSFQVLFLFEVILLLLNHPLSWQEALLVQRSIA